MSSRPNSRASRSSSCVTTSTAMPVASETSRSLDGLKPSPSANSGLQSARRMRCCCSEKRGVARELALDHRRPRAVRSRLVEADDRAADLHQVAVGEPAPAREPQAIDPGAVLRPAVVADRPLARAEGQFRVQARGLGIPGQRDVGLEPPADRDRVGRRLERHDALAPVAIAEEQKGIAAVQRRFALLDLLRCLAAERRGGLHKPLGPYAAGPFRASRAGCAQPPHGCHLPDYATR